MTRDEVQLIGDAEGADGDSGGLGDDAGPAANPRSIVGPHARQALRALLGEAVRFDEPMRRHTTLKLGGPADAYAAPTSIEDVASLARWAVAEGLPLTVVGGGSNLLVRDGGVRGVVLATRGLRGLALTSAITLRVEAGVSTGKVLALATKHELGGVEFLGGVPGSVGGGMIMNAGTYLGEFTNVTTAVTSIHLGGAEVGARVRRDHEACGFRYRASALPPDEVVVEAELALRPRPRAEIEAEVKALRQRRAAREPTKVASNGSTFKNPPPGPDGAARYAGQLIEAAGCKGWQVGDAQCSPVHANWLVNIGAARATELLELIERVRARVLEHHGVALELEVKIIGED